MSHAEVQAFFETYRDAFNRLDGDAVADLWHTPSAITNSGEAAAQLTWWSEDEPMRANHRALYGLYRSSGYQRAEFEIANCVGLGPDMRSPVCTGPCGGRTILCCKRSTPATT